VLIASACVACATPAPPGDQTVSAATATMADTDLRDYQLRALETRIQSMPDGPERDYFSGMLAARFGRFGDANQDNYFHHGLPGPHSEGHSPNGVEHGGAGIGLAEEGGATRGFGSCARFGILVRGDTDERRIAAFGDEPLAKFDAGHLTKMNVEHQAVEQGVFLIREELLCRRIRDRMHARSAKQPAERSAETLVVIDDGDVQGCGFSHLGRPDDVRERQRKIGGAQIIRRR